MVGRGKTGARGKGGGVPSLSKAGARGGSLSEEARNTERHRSCNSDLKLRYSRVAFISAGTSTAQDLNLVIPKSEINSEARKSSIQIRSGSFGEAYGNLPTAYTRTPDVQMSNMTLNDLQSASNAQVKSETGLNSAPKRSNVDSGVRSAERINEAPFIDQEYADELLHTSSVTPITRRSLSPTGSDSSGDVIIFAGRRNNGDQKRTADARSSRSNALHLLKPSGHPSSTSTIIDNPIDAIAQRIQIYSRHRPSSFPAPDSERAPGYVSCNSKVTAAKSGRNRRRRPLREEMKDEGILEDYVANICDGGALETFVETCVLNKRDLDGGDTAKWQGEVESFTIGRAERDSMTNSEEWDSADLENFNELSTSDEVLESINQVLSKRERPSGVQYLVVCAGYTVDDARWFPVSSLKTEGAKTLIQQFESKAELDRLRNGGDLSVANLTIDEQVVQDLHEGLDDKEDGLWERAATHLGAYRSKKTKRSRYHFPSATTFADAPEQDPYNGFDVLDQQRPSLRKRPKGRRGKFSMELSDSELEHSIRSAWEKDRIKKKMRKQERQELRAQGLSGKRNKTDLRAKYPEGISITEVKEEIRDFLLSSMDSLPLPPMAQEERKMVHEIASVFKLKSKSTGSGRSRFPILHRTPRTIQYDEETLKAAESLLSSRRFLPRIDRIRRKGALAHRDRRSGAASAGVSYRDGEVVGAAAPEIGQENRGRTMLERMGWSTGTALGARNNSRGLVQPVTQVVKISRSGLG